MPGEDPTLARLDDQIGWYDRKSASNQRVYKWFTASKITAAALVPLFSGFNLRLVTAALGVVIAVLEGLQQLGQFHHNWITYRSTCESLKHEKFLYLGKAGPYRAAVDAHALLAERIESLVSQEHAKWAAGQEQVAKPREA